MNLRRFLVAAAAAFALYSSAFAAIQIPTTTPYIQNFDGIGTVAAAPLPIDWRVDRTTTSTASDVRKVGTYAAAVTSTSLLGGANLSTSASNGIYNFGAGTTTTGSDRAVGFLASGTATASGNLYVQLVNNSGSSLSGLQISYNVEKYRNGSNASGFRIQMFYSTDGSAWTNAGAPFLTSFPADANNSGFTTAPGTTAAVANQSLSVAIPDGGSLYLAWNYSVTSGSTVTNAQALAIDDVSLLGTGFTPPPPPATPTGLTATAGNAHIALSWGSVTGATSYNVKRSTTSGSGYTKIASPTANAFDDTTAANGTPYFYVVSAVNSGGESGNSSEVSATPIAPPSGIGSANPNPVKVGNSTTLTVTVTQGTNAINSVRADLSSIGGSSSQLFANQGNNMWTFTATVSSDTTTGGKTLPVTITDAQGFTAPATISLTVDPASPPPTGVAIANPASVLPGNASTITVTVTPGSNPPSTGITVTGNLSLIGGSASQAFTDNGDGTFSYTATVATGTSVGGKSLPITIADAQSRSTVAAAALTVLPPTTIKISQLYGGGGNSGSTYTNDFIELFNAGTTPVSLDGWSVQETSAVSPTWTDNGSPTLLSGTIQPGHYYLIQESKGTGGTTALPAADATGVLSIGATTGKVALVASTTPLSGACPNDAVIVDLLGYGGNIVNGQATPMPTCFRTAPANALSNTNAAIRKGDGCVDTANNSADFDVSGGPIPRNSASPAQVCGGDATQLSGFGSATPNSLEATGNALLTVQVSAATIPPSSNIRVVANLSSIGGPASQQLYDDGTNGDQTAGDNIFSGLGNVAGNTTTGAQSILATITDDHGRSATAPITLTVVSPTCGVERWSVKVGTDPDAQQVAINNPVATTITQLRSLTAPASPPDNARVFPWEATVYVINGTLTLFKKETDVDYHIVVQDEQGNTMVTEIPLPACAITSGSPRVPAPSPFSDGMKLARSKFDSRLSATQFFQAVSIPVQIKGVAFFDFIHGQTGVAPNGIELHPIIDINFTNPSTTTVISSANPSQYSAPVTLTASVGNGTSIVPTGNVTFLDGGTQLSTRLLDHSGNATFTTSSLSVGSHSITVAYEGDSTSAPSTSTALVQVVNKADQTIAFAPLAKKTYGDAPFTVTATGGGSSKAVTFAATGNCTSSGVNESTISITGVGSCTVTASQAGDGNYNPAADVSQTFAIDQAAARITVNGYSGAYDGHAHGATGTATGVHGEDLSGLLNLGSMFTDVPGGTAHWTFSGNTNYAQASGDVRITITQASANTSVAGYSGAYDGAPHGATGNATGVTGENLTSLLSLGAAFTNVPGGNANWIFSGNTNYAQASGSVRIIINAALPVINVSGGPFVYDTLPKSATAAATGIGGETVSGSFAFTYNGSAAAPALPGTYAVIATFTSTNTNYANTTGTGTLTIRGVRDDLQNQATALTKLRDAATVKQDIDRLNSAIASLGEALEPDLWLDSIHGTAKEGDEIFQNTKDAVIPILAMLNGDLQPILDRIVADDRALAQTAINDAVSRGAAAKSIDKAKAELLAGDADIVAGRYESALEHYRNAWSFATKA